MEKPFYTQEPGSETVRAYLPSGQVLEVWHHQGWLQIAVHPDGMLTHTRTEKEQDCPREVFAGFYNGALQQIQEFGQQALPLCLEDFTPLADNKQLLTVLEKSPVPNCY